MRPGTNGHVARWHPPTRLLPGWGDRNLAETCSERVTRRRISTSDYEMLVRTVTDYAIYMLDPDGTIASWNAGAECLKGYTEVEIVGQHFSRLLHARGPRRWEASNSPESGCKDRSMGGRGLASP